MGIDTKAGIQKLFMDSLQALAIDADLQLKCTEPGDVPEEISEDYLTWAESYISYFSNELSSVQVDDIRKLYCMVMQLPDSAFCDTNLESMDRPEWELLRVKAKELLSLLGWALKAPPEYINKGHGVFHRK